MAEWTLRPAKPADAARLATCIDAAYSIYADRIDDLPQVSEGVAEDIAQAHVWVVEAGGNILGGAILALNGKTAKLANVAVHPDAGGQGIGKALIQTVERHARDNGARDLLLATHVAMPENVALYQHLGWRETGREGNRVMMSKLL